MRRATTLLAVAGACLLGLGAAAGSGAARGEEIRRASDALFRAGSSGPGEVHAALRRLIEVADELGREARVPAATQAKLDAATAAARRLSPLDSDVRGAVAAAYAALADGRPFAFPKDVGTIEQATAYGRQLLEKGVAAVEGGRPADGAREVTGLVLLVITPMKAPR